MMTRNSRSGFALPVAVFALVVIAVLVTGGFYLARQETRIGVASDRSSTAFYLAERGAAELMSEWDMDAFNAMTQWDTTVTVTGSASEGEWSIDVTRMSSRLFFLESTGRVTAGSGMLGDASRRMGVVARLVSAVIDPDAALTTVGGLTYGGSAFVDGNDKNPPDWGGVCDPAGAAKPGILIDDRNNVTYNGCDPDEPPGTPRGCDIYGNPPTDEDPALTPDSLMVFGDMEFEELAALADIILRPNERVTQLVRDSLDVGGNYTCDTSSDYNWGDPDNPTGACGNHFPIIYARGDLDISASDKGQGILLVEGDLTVSGGHEFYGPVIIKGTLVAIGGGAGGHFYGGVIAANVILDDNTVTGNALVDYSACAVTRAVINSSALTRVRPIEDRSWVDLTSLIVG
jgi:hypothetical protein